MRKILAQVARGSHMAAPAYHAGLTQPQSAQQAQNVQVCCRVRPERNDALVVDLRCAGREVQLHKIEGVCEEAVYTFDKVFSPTSPQREVYEQSARPVIEAILQGFNGTVLAYGPTSSGKTYTMEGFLEDPQFQGIIPRMVWTIFDGIRSTPPQIEFTVKVSIVEIYNDKIRDLLVPCSRRPADLSQNLKVHEDPIRGIYVADCTEIYVAQEQDIFSAIRTGHSHRSVAVTNMNEHSSRSHLIFILTVEQKDTVHQTIKVGKLHLVDLAGAESVAKSGVLGERLDEAKNINKSLSALGNVIHALTDKKAVGHVPYRDSKLTRVLQESLGGNAKTSLIVTVSPRTAVAASTVTSLRFGCRAKFIRNTVNVNQVLSAEQLQLLLRRSDERLGRYKVRVVELEKVIRAWGHTVPHWPTEEDGCSTPPVPGATNAPRSRLEWASVQRRERSPSAERASGDRSSLERASDQRASVDRGSDSLPQPEPSRDRKQSKPLNGDQN